MKKPSEVAIVWWGDAWSDNDSVTYDHESQTPYERTTVGFLIQDDDQGICLASTWDEDDGKVESRDFIPRGMVRRMKRAPFPS